MRATSPILAVGLILAGCLALAELAGISGDAEAGDRGWAPVVVTGSLPPQLPPPRPRHAQRMAEPVETGSAPVAQARPAVENGSEAPARATPERQRATATVVEAGPAQQYCANVTDAAADARFAWQKKALEQAERDIEQRIAKLEEKTAEYQRWMARRDEFVKRAQEMLVNIYTRMRPDAAALQLAATDEETAAAVLSKLDARTSSAILAEMEPKHAARLTTIMVGAAKVPPASSANAASDGKRS